MPETRSNIKWYFLRSKNVVQQNKHFSIFIAEKNSAEIWDQGKQLSSTLLTFQTLDGCSDREREEKREGERGEGERREREKGGGEEKLVFPDLHFAFPYLYFPSGCNMSTRLSCVNWWSLKFYIFAILFYYDKIWVNKTRSREIRKLQKCF